MESLSTNEVLDHLAESIRAERRQQFLNQLTANSVDSTPPVIPVPRHYTVDDTGRVVFAAV